MQAAITSFISTYAQKQNLCFILGQMLELGSFSHTAHQNIVNMLLEQKAEDVYLIANEFAQTTAPYKTFGTTDELKQYLTENPLENKHILLKGSRGNKLESLLPIL